MLKKKPLVSIGDAQRLIIVFCLGLIFFPTYLVAQITISFPYSRIVLQRDRLNAFKNTICQAVDLLKYNNPHFYQFNS